MLKTVLTDNSYLKEKVKLRQDTIPQKNIKVLSCFGGDNKIWEKVSNGYKIDVDIIDILKKDMIYLKGDNIKYLSSMELSKYDVIDLDSYGIPYEQMEMIFKKNYKGIVYITFIQIMHGRLKKNMLEKVGFTESMIKKRPVLCAKEGFEKLKKYLQINNIHDIIYYKFGRKIYLYFKIS